jgi:hypothetical protein
MPLSKFQSIFDAAKDREPPQPPARKTAGKPVIKPKGKRIDPLFEQVTAYIRRDTYKKVKISLLQNDNGKDFSDLVENLLVEYLRTQVRKQLGT